MNINVIFYLPFFSVNIMRFMLYKLEHVLKSDNWEFGKVDIIPAVIIFESDINLILDREDKVIAERWLVD